MDADAEDDGNLSRIAKEKVMFYARKCIIRYLLILGVVLLMGLVLTSCYNPFTRWPKPVLHIAEGESPYGTAPLTITFDISESYDPDGEIVSFTLDFGDGSEPLKGTDITQPIVHTYATPGSCFAKLRVRDNGGATGSVWLAIQANPPTE